MLNALRSIVQHVNDATNFREALDIIVREVRSTMGTEVCSVYLRNEADRFAFVANEGLNRESVGVVGKSVRGRFRRLIQIFVQGLENGAPDRVIANHAVGIDRGVHARVGGALGWAGLRSVLGRSACDMGHCGAC